MKNYVFLGMFILGIITVIIYCNKEPIKYILGIDTHCFIYMDDYATEIFRPVTHCDFCRNLDGAPIEYNISAATFKLKYAYELVPVLIKEATSNWSAMSNFNFRFFKNLYTGMDGALAAVEDECQFFPYNSAFETLSEAFNMSDAHANFAKGEPNWYIGW